MLLLTVHVHSTVVMNDGYLLCEPMLHIRVVPEFGSGSGWNPAIFFKSGLNLDLAKLQIL